VDISLGPKLTRLIDHARFVALPEAARFLGPRIRWLPAPVQRAVGRLEGG
jgi:hypothetical protein